MSEKGTIKGFDDVIFLNYQDQVTCALRPTSLYKRTVFFS